MTESERTFKRARASEVKFEPGEPSIRPVQSTEVWFEDGNIVIHARNVQFRVHRSILMTSSSVFKDMLSEGGADSPFNVSDEAEDMCYLLKAIYDRR